jgi:beta-lactamase regulating signal transducer with metallopeptidase domain
MNVHVLNAAQHVTSRPDWVDRLGWILVHSLWQFALVAGVLGIVLRITIRVSSRARYSACLVALSSLVLLPCATWWGLQQHVGTDTELRRSVSGSSAGLARFDQPNVERLDDGDAAEIARGDARHREPPHADQSPAVIPAISADSTGRFDWRQRLEPWLPTIVWSWLAGVVLFAVRPVLSGWTVRRLRVTGTSSVSADLGTIFASTVSKLGLRRKVRVLQSAVVKVPAVIGYLRPVVLIPLSVAAGFPPDQLEALFAHELAHIRRHDYLVNLLQTAVETLFFYHPAIWWVSAQVRREREDCCDDVALSVCRSQTEYAKALVALEELRGSVPTTAFAAVGGSLLSRIRRIAGVEDEPRPGWGVLVLTAAVSGVFALAAVPSRCAEKADGPAPLSPPSAASAKPAESDDGKFRVRLPDGAVFEMLAVGEDPQDGQIWWQPDGSLRTTAPDGELKSFERELPNNHLRRGFAVNTLADVKANVSSPFVRGKSMSYGRTETNNVAGKVLRKHRFFATVLVNSRTTVFLNYAAGPWKTISRISPDGFREYPVRADDEGVAFDEPIDVKGSSRISAAFSVHGDDVQIVAVDREKREHAPDHRTGSSQGAAHLYGASFQGLPLSKVREFRFQRRPFQHVEFRNVSLHAGQKTNFEIFIDGTRYVPKALSSNKRVDQGP